MNIGIKKMIKKLYNFLIALMAMGIAMSGISNAQADLTKIKEQLPKLLGATNQGTEFVIAFHPAWEGGGPNNAVRIYISSSVETDVRLTIPYFSDQPYKLATTKPNDIIEITLLPNEAQPYTRGNGGLLSTLKHTQVWPGRGIIIEADAPIIVYGMTRYAYTSDGFLAIPTHALDKKYIVSSYREAGDFKNQSLTPYVSIVGIYDKTLVTFSFGGNNDSKIINADEGNREYTPGQTIRATLNRGDDWLIASEGAQSDLGGSMVTANKPIAVFSGNHCAEVPTNTDFCDYIIEQEYPMNAWGRKYYVTPIIGRKKSSEIRLFAKEAHTQFYRDYDTLNPFFENIYAWGIEGSAWITYRASIDTNIGMVVTANKPIEVVQYNPGIEDDGIDSDPFQMMLIPEEQFSNDIIFNTPGIRGELGFNNNYINIVYKTDSAGQIPDDLELGEVVPYTGETNWKKIKDLSSEPGDSLKDPDYINSSIKVFSKTIRLPYDAVWRLKCPTQKIMAYSYGFSSYVSYGFPASAAIADLEKPDTVAPVPYYTQLYDGTTDTINGNYPYVIDMPDDVYLRSNMASIIFDRNNSHNYGFDIKQGDKGWVPGEQRMVHWKAWVIDPSQDGEAIITFSDRAGNDTTILIQYIGVKLTITPTNFDFGNLKIGEEKTQEFTLKNKSQMEVKLSELSLQSMRNELESQGFSIVIPFDINVPMGIEESRTFLVKFKATKEGKFRDSVGVGDSCFYQYKSLVQASVGTPIIHVSDVDFGDKTINTEGIPMTATIQNTETVSLAITGYTGPTINVYRTNLEDLSISETNPWIIGAEETATFKIWFKPDAEQSYPDSIVFISDAGSVVDPVCLISGKGVKPNENKDTMCPVVYYTLLSNGTTDTTNGNYPYVIDMPDDDLVRSNMALITFEKNNSVNYGFDIKDEDKGWVPGVTRIVHWKAWILDPSQDGYAIITFADRAGNDTTILLKYTAGVGVKPSSSDISYKMGKISPHPVGTEGATLDFSIGSDGQTTIRILNSNGTLVSVLVDGLMRAGDYNARIPVEKLVSGVYFIEMQSGEFKEVQKIVVQK